MFSYLNLLVLIFLVSLINGDEFLELKLNDPNEPLVCGLSDEDEQNSPALSPFLYSGQTRKVTYFWIDRIFTACPSNIENKKDKLNILIENDEAHKNTSCKKPVVPAFAVDKQINECGYKRIGKLYSVGYWVKRKADKKNPVFIPLYSICYSDKDGIIFTTHELYTINFENYLPEVEGQIGKEKFLSGFKINSPQGNEVEIQLVPYDDMFSMSWKLATLFDFNYISVNQDVKNRLDAINIFLRSVVNQYFFVLNIHSGVTHPQTSPGSVWYWKIIEISGKGIAIILSFSENPCSPPCKSICNKVAAENLEKIPCTFCCDVNGPLMQKLDAIMKVDTEISYLDIQKSLHFEAQSVEDVSTDIDSYRQGVMKLAGYIQRTILENRAKDAQAAKNAQAVKEAKAKDAGNIEDAKKEI